MGRKRTDFSISLEADSAVGLFAILLVVAFLFILILGIGSCVNSDKTGPALHALESSGVTDARLGDRAMWGGCSKGDSGWHSFEFTGNNAAGKPVSGVVCCGYNWVFPAKGCTIRY